MGIRKSILALLFLYLGGCASGAAVSSTSQTLSNQGLQFLASLVQDLHGALNGSSDCAEFQQILDDLVGTEDCGLGGSRSLAIPDSPCEDVPSFAGQATFSITFQDCQEPGETIGGTVQMPSSWNGSLLITQVESSDYSFNGIPYFIQDLTIEVDTAGMAECSGVLLTQGEICGVTSDCNFCPL